MNINVQYIYSWILNPPNNDGSFTPMPTRYNNIFISDILRNLGIKFVNIEHEKYKNGTYCISYLKFHGLK